MRTATRDTTPRVQHAAKVGNPYASNEEVAMPVRRVVDADRPTETPDVGVTEVERGPWSPAQVVALAIGLFFAVLGGIALARTGLDLNDVHHPHRIVGWG